VAARLRNRRSKNRRGRWCHHRCPKADAPPPTLDAAMRFKQSPVRLHPCEQRGDSLLFDPACVPPGTPIEIATGPGLSPAALAPGSAGSGGRRLVAGQRHPCVRSSPSSRVQLSVFTEAGGHDAELLVLFVRHHASGWVHEIARKDEDSHVEAEFEPETGTVTVYEGRREFKALERAARDAGLPRRSRKQTG
jgi:hypothetical protein